MYRPVPPLAREYYGLAALSANVWKSNGTSAARNLVAYAGGILDGVQEEKFPFCSLAEAFTQAHCSALNIDMTLDAVHSILVGPEQVRVAREGDTVLVAFFGYNNERLGVSLLTVAIRRAASILEIPECDAAVILAAIIASYAYVWTSGKSGILRARVGMTISVKSANNPGREVYGTPACSSAPVAWHPLFYRLGFQTMPFSSEILHEGDCLNPPFTGYHFARSIDSVESRPDVEWVQLVVPTGWLPKLDETLKQDHNLIVTDELTSFNASVSPSQLCSLRVSANDVSSIRKSLMATVEQIQIGWGAHLPWRIPVLVLRIKEADYADFLSRSMRFDHVATFRQAAVLCVSGRVLLAHCGASEPFLLTELAATNSVILTPPGVVVQILGNSVLVHVA